MSAHALLNLLNELGKRDKMRGLPGSSSLFRNKFNKLNNVGYDTKLLCNRDVWRENVKHLSLYT